MINTIQNYQLNNKIVEIDFAKIPELSHSSKKILTRLGAILPSQLQTVETPLVNRIQSITEATQMLQEAKDNSTKNKVFAFLKTALVVALVVAIRATFIFTIRGNFDPYTIVSLLIFISLLGVAYVILTLSLCVEAACTIDWIEKKGPHYSKLWFLRDNGLYPDPKVLLPPLGGGFVMPLFEAYTRETRLKRVLEEQTISVNRTLSEYKDPNNQTLPVSYQFFKNQSSELLDKLNEKIKREKAANIDKLQEESFKDYFTNLEKTRDELNTGIQFYNQFN